MFVAFRYDPCKNVSNVRLLSRGAPFRALRTELCVVCAARSGPRFDQVESCDSGMGTFVTALSTNWSRLDQASDNAATTQLAPRAAPWLTTRDSWPRINGKHRSGVLRHNANGAARAAHTTATHCPSAW